MRSAGMSDCACPDRTRASGREEPRTCGTCGAGAASTKRWSRSAHPCARPTARTHPALARSGGGDARRAAPRSRRAAANAGLASTSSFWMASLQTCWMMARTPSAVFRFSRRASMIPSTAAGRTTFRDLAPVVGHTKRSRRDAICLRLVADLVCSHSRSQRLDNASYSSPADFASAIRTFRSANSGRRESSGSTPRSSKQGTQFEMPVASSRHLYLAVPADPEIATGPTEPVSIAPCLQTRRAGLDATSASVAQLAGLGFGVVDRGWGEGAASRSRGASRFVFGLPSNDGNWRVPLRVSRQK